MDEQPFFRVESDAVIMIVLKELSKDETKVEIISCAAGKGLLSISYGAHSAFAHEAKDLLVRAGFTLERENEISYFDREKCSQLSMNES